MKVYNFELKKCPIIGKSCMKEECIAYENKSERVPSLTDRLIYYDVTHIECLFLKMNLTHETVEGQYKSE